jgi:glycogen debranching enzyme
MTGEIKSNTLARDLLSTMSVLTIQRITLDFARDLLLTMPVLTIQRVTLDLARDLLLTMLRQALLIRDHGRDQE